MESSTAYLTLLGIGPIGIRVVDEVNTRFGHKGVLCVTASNKLDHFRDINIRTKYFVKDDQSREEVFPKLTMTKHLLIVGDASASSLWHDILNHMSHLGEKIIYSFIIPDINLTKIQTDKMILKISAMSTKVLSVPTDIFKIFGGNVRKSDEIEKLVKQYIQIAVNSFVYIFEQYVVYDDSDVNLTKKEMESPGRIYFSFGSNSSESVKEAFDSPLISYRILKESNIKILHVQFHQPISLFTALLLGQWVEKHHIDIRSDHVLIERNTNVEDVALARLWLLD
jgi:hypothetical protein